MQSKCESLSILHRCKTFFGERPLARRATAYPSVAFPERNLDFAGESAKPSHIKLSVALQAMNRHFFDGSERVRGTLKDLLGVRLDFGLAIVSQLIDSC